MELASGEKSLSNQLGLGSIGLRLSIYLHFKAYSSFAESGVQSVQSRFSSIPYPFLIILFRPGLAVFRPLLLIGITHYPG